MNTISMSSENNGNSDLHRLVLNLADEKDLKRSNKYISLSNLSIYYTWENINKSNENSGSQIPDQTCNDKFELHDGSYSASDIEDYFVDSIKKHEI